MTDEAERFDDVLMGAPIALGIEATRNSVIVFRGLEGVAEHFRIL
jgi:hypothetical protein